MANEVVRSIARWDRYAEWVAGITDDEFIAAGLTADDVAWTRSATIGMANLGRAYRNEAKVGVDDPSYFIGKFSKAVVF
jgi:hypothetical protein